MIDDKELLSPKDDERMLLELAAKAAGINLLGTAWTMSDNATFLGYSIAARRTWNPLTDDGDALRLAVKLRFHVSVFADAIGIGTSGKGYEEFKWTNDPYAATRRAIVRAAAAIGEKL